MICKNTLGIAAQGAFSGQTSLLRDVLHNGLFGNPPDPSVPIAFQAPRREKCIQGLFANLQRCTGFISGQQIVICFQHFCSPSCNADYPLTLVVHHDAFVRSNGDRLNCLSVMGIDRLRLIHKAVITGGDALKNPFHDFLRLFRAFQSPVDGIGQADCLSGRLIR